ncbi:hypothetical protein [Clostridium sp.]|uniref:hypothetical protein n=1 Tax=Clostridium sp. TaxID=1506 RepID=UPI002624DC70|nr:hypothetical protein [Clostridium sp.]
MLLSLSLVACGQKNNSAGEDNFSKSSTSQSVSSTQSSGEEILETTSPSVENAVESKQENEDVQKNTQQDTKLDTQPEATEKEYYDLIKEAWQKQKDYIDSIDDPKVKQSVQTSQSAAIMESTGLLMEHPENSEAINASLKRVLAGE